MADKSNIEWTDATWNPIVGCSILTPGCTHCYAMGMAARIEAMTAALQANGQTGAPHYNGTTRKVKGKAIWTGKLALAPDHILTEPLRWRAPRRIFVNSMGDLFHEDVPDEWIDKVFTIMALTPQHTFQVLTKRAKRMQEYLNDAHERIADEVMHSAPVGRDIKDCGLMFAPRHQPSVYFERWPLPNVWLGISAERQQEADERIPELLATPAAVRFVSAEPLLGPIDFTRIPETWGGWNAYVDSLRGLIKQDGGWTKINWIIVGGESGPNARSMHPDWARSIRNQCEAAGVPFFFKQWGEWVSNEQVGGGWSYTRTKDKVRYGVLSEGGFEKGNQLFGGRDFPTEYPWNTEGPGGWGPGPCMIKVGKGNSGRLLDRREHNAFPAVA